MKKKVDSKNDNSEEKEEVVGNLNVASNIEFTSEFSEGLAGYNDASSKLDGYINKQGEVVIEAEYSQVSEFSEGLASVRNADRVCKKNCVNALTMIYEAKYFASFFVI